MCLGFLGFVRLLGSIGFLVFLGFPGFLACLVFLEFVALLRFLGIVGFLGFQGILGFLGFLGSVGVVGFLAPPKVRMVRKSPRGAISLYTTERQLAIFRPPILVCLIFPWLGLGSTFRLGIGLVVACRSIPAPSRASRRPEDFGAV